MIMHIIAALMGALAGVVTGLIPGIHVNTITALLLGSSAALASFGFGYSALLSFTCALAISHTFFDVIPGLFLGVPGDEVYSQLPGHRLVKDGEGHAAIRLSVVGSAMGLMLGLTVMLVGSLAAQIGKLEGLLRPAMFFVLAGVSVVLILTDRPRTWSLFTFLASGFLGVAVFGAPLVAGGFDAPVNGLFPALAGLFGIAGLLFAIGTAGPQARVPASIGKKLGLGWPRIGFSGGIGGVSGLLVGLLPGLGAANAATLLLLIEDCFPSRKRRAARTKRTPKAKSRRDDSADARSYLVTTSSLNTSEALFAIAALYVIERSRSGASIAVEQILGGDVLQSDVTAMAIAMVIAGIVAVVVMLRGGAGFAGMFDHVDESGINWAVIAFLALLTFMLLGLGGLTILVAATVVGLVPLLSGVRRAHLMGFFLVPAMMFFSGYQGQLVELLPIASRTAPLLAQLSIVRIVIALSISIGAAVLVYFAGRRLGCWSELRRGLRILIGSAGGMGVVAVFVLAIAGYAYPGGKVEDLVPPGEVMNGCIKEVIDGDTFRLDSMGRRIRVRLRAIDAPELRTADGKVAAEWVRSTYEDACVDWRPNGIDRYGRIIADVYLEDGTFLNGQIVQQGYAEAAVQFGSDHSEQLERWESEARAAERGIWGAAPSPQERPLLAELERWDDNEDGRITCAEARRHGIAPVQRGHPAYPLMRDPDGDGVVCGSGAPQPSSGNEESEGTSSWDDNGDGRITCAEARRHGIAPVRRGHPAYPLMRDPDGDGVVCGSGAPQPSSGNEESEATGGWDDNGDGRITCAEARRHGIAPVRRGHPAYPLMRDPDGDGVVCGSGAPQPSSGNEESEVPGSWDDNGDGRITCAEARRHGIAPVRRGHPAYPLMRDPDGDGVVCK